VGLIARLLRTPDVAASAVVEPTPRLRIPTWEEYRTLGPYDLRTATAIPTAFRCVQLIASTVTSMPLTVLKGSTPVERPRWLRRPDLYGSPETLAQIIHGAVLGLAGHGEAFLWAEAYGDSQWALRRIPRWRVGVDLDTDGLTRRYTVDGLPVVRAHGPARRSGILHARFLTVDGRAHGLGPIEAARAALASAIDTSDYAGAVFRSGGSFHGWLSTEQDITAATARRYQDSWVERHSDPTDPRPAVLGSGLDWHDHVINPRDAQWIEAREFDGQEVARLWGVPPRYLGLPSGDSTTYANAQDNDATFLRGTITAYTLPLEDVISGLLGAGRGDADAETVRFSAGHLLHPTPTVAWDLVIRGLESGLLSLDEARAASSSVLRSMNAANI
jgi:HK97 family phage portal protein